MHSLFSDWHRLVEIDPTTVDAAMALAVVRLACEEPDSSAAAATFAGLFKAQETTFPMQNNTRLLAVLAGAVAIHSFATLGPVQTLIGYAVGAGQNVGWRPLLPEVRTESASYLAIRADDVRQPISLPEIKKIPSVWVTSLKEQLDSAADLQSLTKAVADMAPSMQAALTALTAENANLRAWATTVIPPLEEEHDMLWWLLTGQSTLADASWIEIQSHAAAILAAWEVSGLVRRLPAPRSLTHMVAQILSFAKSDDGAKLRLDAVVEKLPKGGGYPQLDELWIDLTPIVALANGRKVASLSRKGLTSSELASRALGEALTLQALRAAK
jgi:hypothetical protein